MGSQIHRALEAILRALVFTPSETQATVRFSAGSLWLLCGEETVGAQDRRHERNYKTVVINPGES